jgi:hypothetical protein
VHPLTDTASAPGGRASQRAHQALLCEMELPLARLFFPLGFPIEVQTNDVRVLDAAHASFGAQTRRYPPTGIVVRVGVREVQDAQSPPEPVRRNFDTLYLLSADENNQALLDLGTGLNFTWLTDRALEHPLYLRHNFLEKVVYLLLGASVVTDIHAGCVSLNGKGVLLCGDSGAGKSTLSYACGRVGWTYTSDDTVYLLNDSTSPRVVGHAHRVRFRPAARQLFSELEAHAITPRMEGKASIEVAVADLPPIATAPEAELAAIVYLRRAPEAHARLVRLARGSAPARLAEELYSAGSVRAKHLHALKRLEDVPTFELHYSALDEAIAVLEELTERL